MYWRIYPSVVKFFCGFIYREETIYLKAKETLEKKFGPLDLESDALAFDFTNYYTEEFGQDLKRRFISFKKLRYPSDLLTFKLYSLKIEHKFAVSGRRRINIDPGYLNEAKLVLSTTKDYSHRIYLGKGIYAEVTLYYQNHDFKAFPTTYPDYRTESYKKIFLLMRQTYRQALKNAK
jgi:hypothetical protein